MREAWLPRRLAAWPLGCLAACCASRLSRVLFRQASRRKPAAAPYRPTPYLPCNYSLPPSRS